MAVRTITCLPAVIGAWRQPGGGRCSARASSIPFDTNALERPDLIPPGTRTINMVQLAEALHGELPGPPVRALYVYNSNPAAVCPGPEPRARRACGATTCSPSSTSSSRPTRLDYADIVLPATTQLEHFDIHGAYGHLYVQTNEPAIAPWARRSRTPTSFACWPRRWASSRSCSTVSDEELARQALRPTESPNGYPAASAFDGITLERLQANGPIRLNVPKDYAPFRRISTHPGSANSTVRRRPRRAATRCRTTFRRMRTRDEAGPGREYPLQMVTPPEPSFLNSSFVNVDVLRKSAGEPTVQIHPVDAAKRQIADGQSVTVFNARGRFRARAVVGETVKPGVVVSFGIWWNKYAGGPNCNATTATALTDLGGGATFFDNLVEVSALPLDEKSEPWRRKSPSGPIVVCGIYTPPGRCLERARSAAYS